MADTSYGWDDTGVHSSRALRSLKGLYGRSELDLDRSVVMQNRRDFAINLEQLIDRHLRGSYRIFHREDDVVGNFDKLADERQIV